MRCPHCQSDTKVVDKRDSGEHTRRRRECLACSQRFTTYERLEPVELMVVKKDGRREAFSRDKMKTGIMKALQKRPIGMEQVEKTVDEIEAEMRKTFTTEIPTRAIGEAVIKKLRQLDKVAYIRFASVYRNFTDLGSFEKELNALKQETQRQSAAKSVQAAEAADARRE
jgi:transcriptional repressor NrdR